MRRSVRNNEPSRPVSVSMPYFTCQTPLQTDPAFLSLLSLPSSFVPTPLSCNHGSVRQLVVDFVRKLQWRAVPITMRPSRPNRFGHVTSRRWPPPGLVPPHIHRLTRRIMSIVNSVFSIPHPCQGPSNISPTERDLLSSLPSSDLVVRPADKGGRWVVMSSTQYRGECLRQLSDSSFYQRLPAFLTDTSPRIGNVLQDLFHRKLISKNEYEFLLPPVIPKTRHFSVLPKIHKSHAPHTMPPGRPIISDVGTNSSSVARLLEFFLNPLARHLPSHVRDSFHLIALIRSLELSSTAIFATLDVRALYTNVPVQEGIQRVNRAFVRHPNTTRPDAALLELLRLSLYGNDFSFEGETWIQSSGVAMGKAFGGSFCNIYLGEWETDALSSSSFRPSLWLRYQDDIFLVWDHSLDRLENFTAHLNSRDPHIQVELQHSPSSVRFLDLELFRDGREIGYRVAFKPTDGHHLLPSSSHHPSHTHRGVVYSLIRRWAALCKKREDFERACSTVFRLWRSQGASRTLLRHTVRRVLNITGFSSVWEPGFAKCGSSRCGTCSFAFPMLTFRAGDSLFPILSHLSCTTRGCVYAIRCSRCGIAYVGQTGNTLRQRLSEHLRRLDDPQENAELYRHFRAHNARSYLRVFAIERCLSRSKRLNRESLWIKRFGSVTPNGLNASQGSVSNSLNLVTYRAACTSRLNDAIRQACLKENIPVRLCYRADKNLKRCLF